MFFLEIKYFLSIPLNVKVTFFLKVLQAVVPKEDSTSRAKHKEYWRRIIILKVYGTYIQGITWKKVSKKTL